MSITSKATMADAVHVGTTMAPEDRLEWSCVNAGSDPLDDCITAVLYTDADPDRYRLRTVRTPEGEPLVLGGWDVTLGIAWFAVTTNAKKHKKLVYAAIKECREDALKECRQLVNVVMKSNKTHVRLLEAIGAQFVGPVTNIGGEPFQTFVIHKEDTNV